MAMIIRSADGDVLDSLCHAHYGRLAGTVEAVYAANPGLAARPQPFAAGVVIRLPDLVPPRADVVRLWT
ncbi:tail protein X [Pseudoduganella namucuonensis]|uniref:P2-like prophage tail protein X n=1 Tax=Pseudoduganella namucuonensis TaxID=1035707 RepID=A0A1I7J3R2_9BURK|nr:tail protein X [Pseudoduganella namucuonensis]SFU79782.1 P2-like prophage tail protein X [Pseudoduganella namucuonensis]